VVKNVSWTEKMTHEEVITCVNKTRSIQKTTQHRKQNSTGYIFSDMKVFYKIL